jgi:mono/diheme cytochrome c family protein
MWLLNLVEAYGMMKRIEQTIAFASIIFGMVLSYYAVGSLTVKAAQIKKAATDQAATTKSIAASAEAGGNARRGRELFVKNGCYECHGYEGQGGSYTGPKIAPDPLPWEAIAAFIRNPPGLNSPANKDSAMPPYTSKLVPDKDVQDIFAYLKSVPPGTDMKKIPSYRK